MCEHRNFRVDADVNRLLDKDGGKVIGYTADFHVICDDCKWPFVFICPEMGVSPEKPMASFNHLELRCPIRPEGETVIHPGLIGFGIKQVN